MNENTTLTKEESEFMETYKFYEDNEYKISEKCEEKYQELKKKIQDDINLIIK